MIFRTSYFVGMMACALAAVSASQIIEPAHAETLKITGPNGEVVNAPTRQYGPTTSSDTFWSIAQKVRPNQNVSVYQVMAALFDANPHAFSSNNYNSLERGMTLLVPSADVMAQISAADAKLRAENNDKRLPNANPAKPAANNTTAVETSVPATGKKPLQIVAKQPTAEELAQQAALLAQPEIDELTAKLEDAQTKALSLTDELARAEDTLLVKDADNNALKAKIQELTLQLSAMQEDLQLLTEKYQALDTEHQALVEKNNQPQVIEEPTDFWRSLSENMILLAIVAALPLIIIFLAIFWLMRRKNKTEPDSAAQTEPVIDQASEEAVSEVDDIDNLAVHLDENEKSPENIEDLLDLDNQDTGELTLDGESDADMYITEEEPAEESDEGTSLDDLWAEAMEEQEEDMQPLEADEDDLDSLLEGLDTNDDVIEASLEEPLPVDSVPADSDSDESAAEDDIDNLLTGFDEPAVNESAAEEPAQTDSQSDAQDDIDSLLAGFDEPAIDEPAVNESAAEEPAQTDSQSDAQDDIDSLLAGFDEPANDEPAVNESVAEEPAQIESQSDAQDDIDSLLAGFDDPAIDEPAIEEPAVNESVAEEPAQTDSQSDAQDDIDNLLAGFDEPAVNEPAAEESTETDTQSGAEDDIDSLLASIDVPAEQEQDFTAEIAAELEEDVAVSLDESSDIDDLLADVDTEKEFAPLSNDGLDVEQVLTAELEQIESELAIDTDNDDIDSLISDLETDSTNEAQNQFAETLEESTAVSESDLDELLADVEAIEPVSVNNTEPSDELKFAPGDESTLNIQDDIPTGEQQEDPLVAELLAAEQADQQVQQSHDEQDSDIDELDALLADFNVEDFDIDKSDSDKSELDSSNSEVTAPKVADTLETDLHELELNEQDDVPLFVSDEEINEQDSISEQDFDAMLAGLSADEPDTIIEQQPDTEALSKESGFFDDLKSKKADAASLDWEADLFQQASNHPASEAQVDDIDDETFQLTDDNLTVDEALAALDAEESNKQDARLDSDESSDMVSDTALNTFEQENGFIDIDKLLNDADEDVEISDQYKDVAVEMGEVNSLIGNAEMIDVDDEENSVNAKLDLARAYIEIEDEDAAKAILKEVQIDGNERQQTEAGKLLDEMS
ncbi:FimV/HubP family polar landmark protein [Shewanella sp. MMG014]|uniref:FimV/HubP family polar landmark protein n=1 Tax=Shewanella sp. MMG014 TaxID=2822691 RepID=UPI001FFCB6FD|nr:FimV/HubP family polar landmark protein [Shewanella sp. MMG014]